MNKILNSLFQEVEDKYGEYYKQGLCFNIFKELKLSTNENRHSSILATLINPMGAHGFSDKFYFSFLKMLGISKDDDRFNNIKETKVYTEYSIGNKKETDDYGRIDILIKNGKNAIIIENKIYAKDQEEQIKRYYHYGIKEYTKNHFLVVYLYLDKEKRSKNCTINLLTQEQKKSIKEITYKSEIIDWLRNCTESIEKNTNINNNQAFHIIQQYLHIVEEIVGREDILYHKIILPLMNQSEKYEKISTEDIVVFRDNLRKDLFLKLLHKLRRGLNQHRIVFVQSIHNEVSDNDFNHSKNMGIKIVGINNENPFFIEIQNWSRLIYGLFNPNKDEIYYQKFLDEGFSKDYWWLLKEYPIRNSYGIGFPFYSDFLNHTLSKETDEIITNFSNEIITNYKNIYK